MPQTQLDRIESLLLTHDEKFDLFVERLVVVETNQKNTAAVIKWLGGIIASLFVSAVLYFISLFGGRH